MMDTQQVLDCIKSGEDSALGLFMEHVDPKVRRRFNNAVKSLSEVMDEIRKSFPDAQYLVGDDTITVKLTNNGAEEIENTIAFDSGALLSGKIDGCGW